MTLPTPLVLKGAPGSPYTRKMVALLRYRRIPYRSLVSGSPLLAGLPVPKVELLPTFYLPDAEGRISAATDSTPLIRRFEDAFKGRQARPADPAVAFLDSLLEDYADEWLTKAMFHYRWHFASDIHKAGDILPRWRNLCATDVQIAVMNQAFSRRQIERLYVVGSNPDTAATIEASYARFLDAFDAHLAVSPFLMGERPGASDFAVYGQLTQLTHFDPTPEALTLERAPRVYAWVDLVDDLCGLEPVDPQWMRRDAIPATVITLLREVARTYVPVMLANARALMAGAKTLQTEVDGVTWVQQAFPYQGKCLRWLRDEFAALGPRERQVVDGVLEQCGCAALVHEVL